jgi:sirohydrochlorin cobaltochelatase
MNKRVFPNTMKCSSYTILTILLLISGVIMDLSAETSPASKSTKNNTAIVLVAFGSTAPSTIQTYNSIEKSFKDAFPKNSVSWAYTSDIVIRKLREKGKYISNVDEAVKNLVNQGYTSIVLQSLHIMPGEEFLSLQSENTSSTTIIGQPLLASDNDIAKVAEIVSRFCKSTIPTVIAAHGNGKNLELNAPLLKIASIIESKNSNTVLCTVEGTPGTEPMKRLKTDALKKDSVIFVPFMLIAGVHVQDDLMGQEESSWKNIMGIKNARITSPLGDLPEIHAIFIDHCKLALEMAGKK